MYFVDSLTSSSTASNANWIISLSDIVEYIKEDTSQTGTVSAFYSNCISRVSDRIETYCQLPIASQSFYGLYNGSGCNELPIRNYPIISVSSLKYRNKPTESWTNIITSGSIAQNCLIYSYKIELYNYSFPCGSQNIEIQYIAGFNTIPDDIKQVALEMSVISIKESTARKGGDGSRLGISNVNSGSNNFGTTYISLDERHEKILDNYRKIC